MAMPRATPVSEGDSALVRVLEATIEALKLENEMLRRRLAAAETRTARDTAAAQAIAEFPAITKRLRARVAAFGDDGLQDRATPTAGGIGRAAAAR
jgi:regulator of replication initiation timing